ncbi:hypothetical protein [Campylobacter portucalensis]|nr:hypothetical protein [Campylobacter portucalensis]
MKRGILSLAVLVSFCFSFDANFSKSQNQTGINLEEVEWRFRWY